MSILEKIAELPLGWVAAIVVLLWIARVLLLRRGTPLAKQIGETCESLAIAGALVFFIIRPFIVQSFYIPSESMMPGLRVNDHLLVSKFSYRLGEPKRGDVVVFLAPPTASPDGQRKDLIKRLIAVPGDTVRVVPGRVDVDGVAMNHKDIRESVSDLVKPGDMGAVRFGRDSVSIDGTRVSRAKLAAELGADPRKVRIVPGKVYVNGKAIDEPYMAEDPDDAYPVLHGQFATPEKWLTKNSKGELCVKVPRGRLLMMGDNRNNSFDSRFWGLLDRRDVLGKAMFRFWPLNRMGIIR